MNNKELIHEFIHGKRSGQNGTGSIHIENFQNRNITAAVLYSYATPIIFREFTDADYMTFYIVDKKFSVTTSKHQSIFKMLIERENSLLWNKYKIVELSPFVFSESLKKYQAGLGRLYFSS